MLLGPGHCGKALLSRSSASSQLGRPGPMIQARSASGALVKQLSKAIPRSAWTASAHGQRLISSTAPASQPAPVFSSRRNVATSATTGAASGSSKAAKAGPRIAVLGGGVVGLTVALRALQVGTSLLQHTTCMAWRICCTARVQPLQLNGMLPAVAWVHDHRSMVVLAAA